MKLILARLSYETGRLLDDKRLWFRGAWLMAPGNRTLLLYIMSEEHKMTKQDKLVLTITLAAIFFGVFG